MPRTYRHNLTVSKHLERERCEECAGLAVQYRVCAFAELEPAQWVYVCEECVWQIVRRLRAQNLEVHVGVMTPRSR